MELKKNPSVDLSRWSNVFFLVGFATMLFISWRMLEWKSVDRGTVSDNIEVVQNDLELDVPITQQVTPPPPPPPPPMAAMPQIINVVENTEDVEESVFESSEADQNQEIVEIESIEEVEEEEEIPFVPFAVIEDVPIYPGCESLPSNEEKKKCLADNVMAFVQKKFNTDLANELGLEGRQRISVQFKIDRHGQVINVRARAPHPRLEQEAVAVVGSLPKMIPGKQRGKPVGVLYALPILFQVEVSN
ncbi:MAG: energy transducer TonB [Aureisphaera sp.]